MKIVSKRASNGVTMYYKVSPSTGKKTRVSKEYAKMHKSPKRKSPKRGKSPARKSPKRGKSPKRCPVGKVHSSATGRCVSRSSIMKKAIRARNSPMPVRRRKSHIEANLGESNWNLNM